MLAGRPMLTTRTMLATQTMLAGRPMLVTRTIAATLSLKFIVFR